ncbi:MAG: hypothetical protein GYB68_15570 [Chloroflexi bacterium]|nr:hypothetical protein [Chloroflexota bacterium]
MTTATLRTPRQTRGQQLTALRVVALALMWIALWGAWIPGEVVSLNQNALDLAEWSTRLEVVRFGGLRLLPDFLRLAVALGIVTLAVSFSSIRPLLLRWSLRAVAALPGLIMLPPYAGVASLVWWVDPSQYLARFGAALVLWLGIAACLIIDGLPEGFQDGLLIGLSVGALALASWAFLMLRGAFADHYPGPVGLGWGYIGFCWALLLTVALSALRWQLGRSAAA